MCDLIGAADQKRDWNHSRENVHIALAATSIQSRNRP